MAPPRVYRTTHTGGGWAELTDTRYGPCSMLRSVGTKRPLALRRSHLGHSCTPAAVCCSPTYKRARAPAPTYKHARAPTYKQFTSKTTNENKHLVCKAQRKSNLTQFCTMTSYKYAKHMKVWRLRWTHQSQPSDRSRGDSSPIAGPNTMSSSKGQRSP